MKVYQFFLCYFSKFIKEFNEVLEEKKENISKDGYADFEDISGMMDDNFQKIASHGQSINCTLRVMEDLLNQTGGTMVKLEINKQISTISQCFYNQNKEELDHYGVQFAINLSEKEIYINGDAEALNKICLCICKNALYAVKKKRERESFSPEISVTIVDLGTNVEIRFADNGIGIEKTIIEKIYDPYFTTKPSADASGIGLYYVREEVMKHKETISVNSEPNNGCVFRILLPCEK